jgi:transcriptional regulator of acetoin/glycerol metabolism
MAELRRHNGSRSLAARSLGMDRSTLWRKLKKYQLNGP